MANRLSLDTSFLIDLSREVRKSTFGSACQFLERTQNESFFVPVVVVGEFLAGYTSGERQSALQFLAPFTILDLTAEVGWTYSRTYRYLQGNGQLIGSNDLWIAATALTYGMPLVTGNTAHFRRVPGLEVVSYRNL